jgi:hypothetical protein
VSRWKSSHPAFAAALNRARRQQFDDAIAALDSLAIKAFDGLGELMGSPDDKTRLEAIKLYLSYRGQLTAPAGDVEPLIVAKRWELEDKRAVSSLNHDEFLANMF